MNFFSISYSKKLSIFYFLILISILIGLFFLVYYLLSTNIPQIIGMLKIANPQYITAIVSFLIGFSYALILLFVFNRFDNIIDNLLEKFRRAKKGVKGENLVFSELERILDKNLYKVHPNFKIPGEKFDIDALIIGPKGLLLIEIKNLSGKFHFINGNVYKQNFSYKRDCWRKLNDWENPIKEVQRHKEKLKEFLKQNNFGNIALNCALVMTGSTIGDISDPKIYIITGMDRLSKYIGELRDNPLFTPEFCTKIVKDLKL